MVKLEVLARRCRAVLRLSAARVSEWSKSLWWWRASRFLSLLACRLSSFCWAANRLPYIWTRSGVVFYLRVLNFNLHRGILSGICQKIHKLCINPYISVVKPLQTDIYTNIQTQTYKTKTPLAPTAPARLWASRYGVQQLEWCQLNLVPRPCPAFRRFQYGKAGEGLVSFLTWVTSG